MPLYEYQCKKCKHRFEKIQSFSDAPIKKCPSCGANAVEKLLSAPAVHFKGSGFYVTDYAKKSSSEGSASSEKGESKGSSKDGAGNSDSGSSAKTPSETKSSEKPSSESKAAPAEPKGDPRGQSSHSKRSKRP